MSVMKDKKQLMAAAVGAALLKMMGIVAPNRVVKRETNRLLIKTPSRLERAIDIFVMCMQYICTFSHPYMLQSMKNN